ncbi:MAG: Lipopolysaccharide export system ATP-binding protein LptB [Candidatus Anoxychlamydiales bacterium]|nr:Lipopolysaccharide export system ATP-binding protein LptB [Candidatus Anoxychlamydiales bacterium]NGX36024.1 Lipopolysaccharide export system ATP-binding protein LptB [Candidatus Anoxychlamydiales bacterium]
MYRKKSLLKVENLVKTYSSKPVVNGLSFEVKEKEIIGLLGPNGAGKTTAFYMTIGLIKANSGKVYFKGKEISKLSIHQRARLGMGYLAQEPSVFRQLTVEENILCILETLNISKKEKYKRLESLLNELHLAHLSQKKAITLSGGERRRLEITRALVREPKLLLLDEPFANIDPLAIADVKKLIKILKKKSIGILITDHNAREIFSIVDRSYIMQDGKVMLSGKVNDLIKNANARKYYLGDDFSM